MPKNTPAPKSGLKQPTSKGVPASTRKGVRGR